MAVELHGLIRGAYRHMEGAKDLKAVQFSVEMKPEEIVLYADTEQLERVFINLFSNAIDAMSGRGALTVRAVEEDSMVKISVTDTGSGMSRDTLENIFEPFFTTKDKGTGLGLAIVFNIIQKHEGTIKVKSDEGRGTTFMISLPKKKPHAVLT
jgi:signal transduction histidine kinase